MRGLINIVGRDVLIRLRSGPALLATVPVDDIHDQAPPNEPAWPFVLVGSMSMTPRRAAKINDGSLIGSIHGFSRGNIVADQLVETAKDHAGRIGAAIEATLDGAGGPITDGTDIGHVRYLLADRQMLVDSGEAGAFHWFANVVARVTAS